LQPEQTKKIQEAVLFTGAILVITVLGIYIPFLAFFWPVPVALSVLRQGGRSTIGGIVIAALAAGLLWDNQVFLAVILVSGLVGLIMGGSIAEGFSGKRILYYSVAAAVLSQAIFLAVNQLVLDVNYWELIEQVMQEAAAFYDDPTLQEAIPSALQIFRAIFPTLLFISGALTGVFSLSALRFVASKWQMELPDILNFRSWRVDPRLIVVLLVTLGLSLLFPGVILLNLFLGIIVLFCGGGLSVIAYWIGKRVNQVSRRVLLIAAVFLLIFPVLGAIVVGFIAMFILPLATVLGLLDSWRDLRNLNRAGGG